MKNPSKDDAKKKNRNFWGWVQEHVKPDIGFGPAQEDQVMNSEENSNNRLENFIHKVRIGFRLIWKF